MIVTDVSAVIPYILYKDQDVEKVILEADRIISPVLYVSECGNTLLQYVKKERYILDRQRESHTA